MAVRTGSPVRALALAVMSWAGANLTGVQQHRDPIDDLFQRVSPGAEPQLRSRNLAGTLLTPDRDLGDLGGLEYAFQESATVGIMGL